MTAGARSPRPYSVSLEIRTQFALRRIRCIYNYKAMYTVGRVCPDHSIRFVYRPGVFSKGLIWVLATIRGFGVILLPQRVTHDPRVFSGDFIC